MSHQLSTLMGRVEPADYRAPRRCSRIPGRRSIVRALDEISLRFEGGTFVSIVGPSGAGKSTLLHLLGALDSPDSGSITFDGDEIGHLSDEEQENSATIASGSSFSSSICCRPCPHGRTWRSRDCLTASGWARSSRMRFGCWTGLGSATGPSIGRRNCRAVKCSGWRWHGR